MHKYPEGGFKEFKTQQTMIDNLVSFGVEEENIKKCAGTGLVVDIWGKDQSKSKNGIKMIALRTDLDGLPIPENN